MEYDDYNVGSESVAVPYAAAIWFQLGDTVQAQFAAIFSSDNLGAGYQIDFRDGNLRIRTSSDVIIAATSELGTGWNLLTWDQRNYWLNDGHGIAHNQRLDSMDVFALGTNRNRDRGVVGKISDLIIYDTADGAWSDSAQAALFARGPTVGIPESSAFSLISGIMILFLFNFHRRRRQGKFRVY